MLPDVAVHLIQRGNNRSPCFFSEEDRRHYLFHLRRLLGPADCKLHAYCLMTNHVHLLVTPTHTDSCSLLMKRLGQLQAQYVNRVYRRSGTLWEGRFKSCLVQSEGYVLCCYRYIELNPVRAGMVSHPGDYEWSSFRSNGEGSAETPIRPHPEYLRLGANEGERRSVYRSLFGSPLDSLIVDEIRVVTNGGFVLGDRSFRKDMAERLQRPVEKGIPGRPRQSSPETTGQDGLFPIP